MAIIQDIELMNKAIACITMIEDTKTIHEQLDCMKGLCKLRAKLQKLKDEEELK